MPEFIITPLGLNELETLVLRQVRKALSENQPTQTTTNQDELLTIKKVAEFLSVSVPTIYGYVHQRSIPFLKRRGRLYFSKEEILMWIHAGRRSTFEEIREEARKSLER